MTGHNQYCVFHDISIVISMNFAKFNFKHYFLPNNCSINLVWIQILNSTAMINLNITNDW